VAALPSCTLPTDEPVKPRSFDSWNEPRVARESAPTPPRKGIVVSAGSIEICQALDKTLYPSEWDKSGRIEVDPLPDKAFEVAARAIWHNLDKYPREALEKQLASVVVARRFNFNGVTHHVTRSSRVIYLSHNPDANEEPASLLENNLHYQIAALLLEQKLLQFAMSEWDRLLPVEARYFVRSRGELPEDSELTWTRRRKMDIEDGFLTYRSQVSPLDDICWVSAGLFVNSEEFWRAVRSAPRLSKKVDHVIRAYNMWDAHLTYQYFRALPRGRADWSYGKP
jgi:hypothetical protein